MAYFEFVHNIGLHAWDIPALAALVLFAVLGLVHKRNQDKREKEFEDEMNAAKNENK